MKTETVYLKDPNQIEKAKHTLLALNDKALEEPNLRLFMNDHTVLEGTYKACNTWVTDQGFAAVVRFTPKNAESDSPVQVIQIEKIECINTL